MQVFSGELIALSIDEDDPAAQAEAVRCLRDGPFLPLVGIPTWSAFVKFVACFGSEVTCDWLDEYEIDRPCPDGLYPAQWPMVFQVLRAAARWLNVT